MSDQATAELTAETAANQESAPENQEVAASTEQAVETPVDTGSEPEQPKAVKELIAQRKRRQEAEKEAAYWRGVAEANSRKPEQQEVQKQPAQVLGRPPVEPVLDNFESYDQFELAVRRYTVDLAKYELQQEVQQREAAKENQRKIESFKERLEKITEEDSTIADIVSDKTLPIHPTTVDLLRDSDHMAAILKKLNADRKEAQRLFNLCNTNPMAAAREFGKMELAIASTPKPEPPKRVSQAPEPIKPVAPAGNPAVDESNLPLNEWIARRNKAVGYR